MRLKNHIKKSIAAAVAISQVIGGNAGTAAQAGSLEISPNPQTLSVLPQGLAGLSDVDVDTLPSSLNSFLHWFNVSVSSGWGISGNCTNGEYDSRHAADGGSNILVNMLCNNLVHCVDYSLYPGNMPEVYYKPDPKGWSKDGYTVYDGPMVDWIARNILNVSGKDLKALRKKGKKSRLFYRKDTADGSYCYYVPFPGAYGIGWEGFEDAVLTSAKYDGKKYYIEYDMYETPPMGNAFLGSYYAEMEYKTIDGRKYWSVYQHSKDAPPTPTSEGKCDEPRPLELSPEELRRHNALETLSAGGWFTAAVGTDGTAMAVGENDSGQCNLSAWKNIIAVSAGINHVVGLRADGTVVAAGSNDDGECNVANWTDIVAISAGGSHTVGLRSDGTVVAAGSNDYDQCAVFSWTGIVAVSAGDNHTVGLCADGTVVAVGKNEYGECGVSDWRDIVSVSAGYCHTAGLRSDGTVVAVGPNYYGECNVADWRDITAVSVGGSRTVGLREDGTVVAVGYKYPPSTYDTSGWTNIVAISAGTEHMVGLRADGTAIATGQNYNVLGDYTGQCDVTKWANIVTAS